MEVFPDLEVGRQVGGQIVSPDGNIKTVNHMGLLVSKRSHVLSRIGEGATSGGPNEKEVRRMGSNGGRCAGGLVGRIGCLGNLTGPNNLEQRELGWTETRRVFGRAGRIEKGEVSGGLELENCGEDPGGLQSISPFGMVEGVNGAGSTTEGKREGASVLKFGGDKVEQVHLKQGSETGSLEENKTGSPLGELHKLRFLDRYAASENKRVTSKDGRGLPGSGGEFASIREEGKAVEVEESEDGLSLASKDSFKGSLPSVVEESTDVLECDDGSVAQLFSSMGGLEEEAVEFKGRRESDVLCYKRKRRKGGTLPIRGAGAKHGRILSMLNLHIVPIRNQLGSGCFAGNTSLGGGKSDKGGEEE